MPDPPSAPPVYTSSFHKRPTYESLAFVNNVKSEPRVLSPRNRSRPIKECWPFIFFPFFMSGFFSRTHFDSASYFVFRRINILQVQLTLHFQCRDDALNCLARVCQRIGAWGGKRQFFERFFFSID